MEVFDYEVEASLSGNSAHRTLGTPFGDGYEQEAGDGINTRKESWRISAVGRLEDDSAMPVSDIADFIDRHAGYKAFHWTTPRGRAALFKCRGGYSLSGEGGGNYRLSANFEEVFHP